MKVAQAVLESRRKKAWLCVTCAIGQLILDKLNGTLWAELVRYRQPLNLLLIFVCVNAQPRLTAPLATMSNKYQGFLTVPARLVVI
jgi:hypothetical protein